MDKKDKTTFYLSQKHRLIRYARLFAEVVEIMEELPEEDPNKIYLKEQAFRLLEILDQELTARQDVE